jgi:uncharacterized membrane protein HdeD (DUF308 family)
MVAHPERRALCALMLNMPGAGALALIWVIGAYSIIFGALLVGFALRLKKHSHG